MAGLPRKYAKMGFSRGWRAYRASQSRSSTPKVKTMARRRKGFFRRSARRAARYVRRGTKTSSAQLFQVDAMLYGAVRAPLSNLTSNLVSPILGPVAGDLSDEVGCGLADWLIAKHTSGMISDIAKKGLVVENARVGEYISQKGLGAIAGGSAIGPSQQFAYG